MVRDGPPKPAPPPKDSQRRRLYSSGRGMWTGIVAVALVVFLILVFVVPGSEDTPGDNRSRKVDVTPAPAVTPK